MQIPADFISELVSRADIIDTISRYVTLKRSGSQYLGLCPFHGEKTPSFSVSPDKQLFHCFGCHAGGDVISFVMRAESMEFVEAVKLLAGQNGLELPEFDDGGLSDRKARILEINKMAARWFYQSLADNTDGIAQRYVFQRGMRVATVRRFGIGFAPGGWDNLLKFLKAKGYEGNELLEAGLVSSGDRGVYDRFRNRLMFPILDIRGQVIAFGGRALDDAKAKYLNSPETKVFSKGKHLFALNLAKKTQARTLMLVEGYMDVVSLHQAGIDYAIASLGTALTDEQATLIKKFAERAVIAYDSDNAGRDATDRAIKILTRHNVAVKVLTLRGAKDPDEYLKAFGVDAFSKAIEESESHVEYRITRLAERYDMTANEQRVAFLAAAAAMLAALDSPAEAAVYTGKAAGIAGVDTGVLEMEVRRERAVLGRKNAKKESRQSQSPAAIFSPEARELKYENLQSARTEEELLQLISGDPSLIPLAAELEIGDFSSPLLGRLFACFSDQFKSGKRVEIAGLASQFDPAEMSHLSKVLARPISMADAAQRVAAYIDVIKLESAMKEAQQSDSNESLIRITEEIRRRKGGL